MDFWEFLCLVVDFLCMCIWPFFVQTCPNRFQSNPKENLAFDPMGTSNKSSCAGWWDSGWFEWFYTSSINLCSKDHFLLLNRNPRRRSALIYPCGHVHVRLSQQRRKNSNLFCPSHFGRNPKRHVPSLGLRTGHSQARDSKHHTPQEIVHLSSSRHEMYQMDQRKNHSR